MKDRVLGTVTHVMVMAIVIAVILLFMGIIILVLFHLCITGGFFQRELENDGTVDRGSLGCSSMSRDDVEKLPCFNYKDKEKGVINSSSADCAVCLEDFKAGEKCRLLPLCKHSFHANCVDSWLLITPFCPICRTCADSIPGEEEIRPRLDGIVVELGENQTAESQQLTYADNALSETVGSSDLGGFVIELGDNQTENRQLSESIELGDSQTTKSGYLSDI